MEKSNLTLRERLQLVISGSLPSKEIDITKPMNYRAFEQSQLKQMELQQNPRAVSSRDYYEIPTTNFQPKDSPDKVAENQRSELRRHQAILNGKRKFKEIETNLGLDLQIYPKKNLEFLQKLNNLLLDASGGMQPNIETTKKQEQAFSFPIRSSNQVEEQWFQNEGETDAQAMKRIKKRIEKEVFKQESLYHRQHMDIKIKSLEQICLIQSEKLQKMQQTFDTALAQTITILQVYQNGGPLIEQEEDKVDHDDGQLIVSTFQKK